MNEIVTSLDWQAVLHSAVTLVVLPVLVTLIAWLRQKLGEAKFNRAREVVKILVMAAEQAKVQDKKQYVIDRAEEWLKREGINNINISDLIDLLEAGVWNEFKRPVFEERVKVVNFETMQLDE